MPGALAINGQKINNMRLLPLMLFLLLPALCLAQVTNLSALPAYDCSLTKVMAIVGRPTVIVSPDKSTGLEGMLNDYCSTFGNNCLRKKESALTDTDYTKDMLVAGVITAFKKWNAFKLPIPLVANGFLINGQKFQQKNDGFAFVDTNRIVIAGNSIKAVKDVQLAFTGGHDIVIVQNGKITFFGNRKGKGFNWFNLQNLKTTNYIKKPSALFSAVYVSKTYTDTINYAALNKQLNAYAKQFISIYHIKMPVNKISWFLHTNMQEYGTMSGMFGLTCPGNASAGFSIRGEIHTNGYNTPLVKHEYSHYLFDNNIPQDNNPAFFVEGCVEYVTNLNDNAVFKERVAIALKTKDSLNYTGLVIDNKDFYGQYSSYNYSVCGVFVKYIVDTWGVEAFKKFCLSADKQQASVTLFKTSFANVVAGYKNWLLTQ